MRAKQPDKSLMRRRVEEILRIRLDGAEWWDCCEYVREKEQEEGSAWRLADGDKPLTDASLRRYLQKADQLIAESCRASRKKLLRRHLAQRRNLYAKSVSQGDMRSALACVRDEAELLGLYPPKKIAPTTPDGEGEYHAGSLTPAEVAALLRDVASRLGLEPAGPGEQGPAQPPGPPAPGAGPDLPPGGADGRPVAG
jgi:hypothetical protein